MKDKTVKILDKFKIDINLFHAIDHILCKNGFYGNDEIVIEIIKKLRKDYNLK